MQGSWDSLFQEHVHYTESFFLPHFHTNEHPVYHISTPQGCTRYHQKSLTHGHADLLFAMKEVSEIHQNGNHITTMLSQADLLQMGGYAAVEYCGGPSMVFKMGREDMESEADASASKEESSLVAQETHRNSVVVARMQAAAADL